MHVVAAGSAFDLPLPNWDFRGIAASARRVAAVALFSWNAAMFAGAVWLMVVAPSLLE